MRGESFSAINAKKTHCVNGHEFTIQNTIIRKNNRRGCRKCRDDYHASHKDHLKESHRRADKKYRTNNKEKEKKRHQKYNRENRDKINARRRMKRMMQKIQVVAD